MDRKLQIAAFGTFGAVFDMLAPAPDGKLLWHVAAEYGFGHQDVRRLLECSTGRLMKALWSLSMVIKLDLVFWVFA